MTDTTRGALLMTIAMALFAVEDAVIKGLAGTFSAAQIIWMLGFGGVLALTVWFAARGEGAWSPHYRNRYVLLRTGFEAVGSLFFVSALAVVPLALASAVVQATPLMVAMGGAVFLGARVGWRRWLAILVGFGGVLVILRPFGQGFEATTLLAVFGMVALAGRDLTTRIVPADISGVRLSFLAFLSLVFAGAALQIAQGAALIIPTLWQTAVIALCVAIGLVAYLTIVAGTRTGDIAVVSSFRYTRMIFALIVAGLAFDEQADVWTVVGVSIVIATGVFTLMREARMRTRRLPKGPAAR
ncbi:MAG: DMT family transporter [Jannaschia sp.]